MSRVIFSNAAFLTGLAALAIPILIHLFLRRRKTRLRFSTLQFFVKQDEKAGRRRKLLNWLLLAARLLLLALVVVAFARPYLADSPSSSDAPEGKNIVIVLDRSASMQATDAGGSRWTKAADILRATTDELGFRDRVGLVECATRTTILSPLAPPQTLKPVIERLEPGFGSGDVEEGLQEAVKLLSAKSLHGQLVIHLISDMQRQSCQRLDSVSVPQNIDLKLVSISQTNTPNVAISDLSLGAGNAALQATVANFSDHAAPDSALDWIIDDRKTGSAPVSLGAGSTTNVTASLAALAAGWHKIEARLQSHDPLALDDVRYQVLQVPAPLEVLCVETRETKHVFEEESFFLASALQPGGTNSPLTWFDIEKARPDEMVGKLTGGSASRYQIVLIPALRQLPDGFAPALIEFVKNGGGALLFVGDGLSASRYNTELGGLLPATLDQIEGDSPAFEKYWRLGDFNSKSTVFAAFRSPHSGDLSLPGFWRRYAMTPVEPSQVLAGFRDAVPFLVVREIGRGRVALVNTSADTSWSDWPKHKTFVPWLHGVCHYLAGNEMSYGMRPVNSFIAGARAEVDLGTGAGRRNFTVHPPVGAVFTVKASDQGGIELPLEKPGVYSIADSAGQTVRLLAVNPPQRESDLSAYTSSEVQQQLVRSQAMSSNGLAAGMYDPEGGGKALWRVLMTAAAVLLMLETVLANRTFA
jgi:hypothetical protein